MLHQIKSTPDNGLNDIRGMSHGENTSTVVVSRKKFVDLHKRYGPQYSCYVAGSTAA